MWSRLPEPSLPNTGLPGRVPAPLDDDENVDDLPTSPDAPCFVAAPAPSFRAPPAVRLPPVEDEAVLSEEDEIDTLMEFAPLPDEAIYTF